MAVMVNEGTNQIVRLMVSPVVLTLAAYGVRTTGPAGQPSSIDVDLETGARRRRIVGQPPADRR